MWIEWNSRIGVCNSDQAVIGLGPPDKSAKLTDGTIVAEWMMRRGCSGGLMATPTAAILRIVITNRLPPDSFVHLTFGRDGRLQAHERVAR